MGGPKVETRRFLKGAEASEWPSVGPLPDLARAQRAPAAAPGG